MAPRTLLRPTTTVQSAAIGMAALRVNPLRTVLSTLGMVVGVGALVSVVALGDGVERFAREQIEQTTSLQIFTVNSVTTEEIDGIRIARTDPVSIGWDEFRRLLPLPDGGTAVLVSRRPARVTLAADGEQRAAWLSAQTEGSVAPSPPTVMAGRWLSSADIETAAHVAIISSSLLPDSTAPRTAIGETVTVVGESFEVVGVIDNARSEGNSVLIPFTSTPVVGSPTLEVRAATVEGVEPLREFVSTWLEAKWGDVDDNFVIASQRGRLEQTRRAIQIFTILMGSLAAISVIVGGIGIMNILLASVVERTREIGIRKSIGARRRDIMTQFLAESVAISSVGSVLGVGLGWAMAALAAALMRVQTEAAIAPALTTSTLFVAATAAVLVGIAFGTYPAVRAARLTPIDAIRHE